MFLSVSLKKHVNICVWMDFEKKKKEKEKQANSLFCWGLWVKGKRRGNWGMSPAVEWVKLNVRMCIKTICKSTQFHASWCMCGAVQKF